jgi:FMN phosphatase YigB (HAD superfamily)
VSVEAIVFDLWGTIGFKPFGVQQKLKGLLSPYCDQMTLQQYEQAVQLREWNNLEELSSSFMHSFNIPRSRYLESGIRQVFEQSLGKSYIDAVMKTVLFRLQDQFKLGLISNTTSFESKAVEMFGIGSCFEVISYSWQTGHLKPSPAAFETLTRGFGLQPSSILFIDDDMTNIEAAVSSGLYAIRFVKVSTLLGEIQRVTRNVFCDR